MSKIIEVLHKMQKELKVPKSQYNSFGKYKYRSCEDIVEAVKDVLPEGYTISLSDEIIMLGDRFYIKAQALLCGVDGSLGSFGYAREPENKKGMDESQITGTASSYARKYALNGLFAIDDTKDSDTNEHKKEVIANGILDTEARDEAKLAFIKDVNDRLNKTTNLKELDNALTEEQTVYLKDKLSKIDPIAYQTIKNRFAELNVAFKKIAKAELLETWNNA